MKVFPIHNSFAAGEISPLLHMRTDIPALQNGAKRMENVVALSHGAAKSRLGSQLIDNYPGLSTCKLFEFRHNAAKNFVIVMRKGAGQDDMLVYGGDGTVPVATPILTNDSFGDGMDGWTEYKSVAANGTITPHEGSLTLQLIAVVNTNTTIGVSQSFVAAETGIYEFRAHFGFLDTNGYHFTVRAGITLGVPFDEYKEYSTGDRVISYTKALTAGNTYYCTLALFSSRFETTVGVRMAMVPALSAILIPPSTATSVVSASNPYTVSQLAMVRAEKAPGTNLMYLTHSAHPPRRITYFPTTNTWSYGTLSFTGQPAEWVAGNYPSMVTFYQGRSWWAGCPLNPGTFWASKSGSYLDLTTGALADDGLVFTLSHAGAIHGMKGASTLVLLTDTGEHVVEAEGGIIAPGDINVKAQSATGARNIAPIDAGNKVIFADSAGSKLHDMGYRWEEDKWVPRDISYVSEHLLRNEVIQELSFATNPRTVVVVTVSGKLILCSYDDANNIIGWHRHPMAGQVLSSVSTSIDGRSYTYIAHLFGGSIAIERIGEGYCLNRFVQLQNTPAANSITGATSLANLTVGVLTDGKPHPDVTLDANGNANLQWPAEQIVVGLRYVQKLTTLPVMFNSSIGTGLGMAKRWNKIYLRLVQSYIPKINGKRPRVQRSDTLAFEAEGWVEDGFIEVTNLGFSPDGTIEIEQDEPLPICITGVYGELNQESIRG